MGAEVSVFRADIADKEQMQTVVRLAEEKFGTIHGVIHAAGVMKEEHFKLISDLEREDCLIHFKPKIHGLYVLDELFKDKDLDFCMLTSSLSSILGGLTLYAYSAANSFMDGFAWKQARASGNHWISINWEGWEKDNLPGKGEGHQGLKKLATLFFPHLAFNPNVSINNFLVILNFFGAPFGDFLAGVQNSD